MKNRSDWKVQWGMHVKMKDNQGHVLKVNIRSWFPPHRSDHFPVSSASRSGANLVSSTTWFLGVEVTIFRSVLPPPNWPVLAHFLGVEVTIFWSVLPPSNFHLQLLREGYWTKLPLNMRNYWPWQFQLITLPLKLNTQNRKNISTIHSKHWSSQDLIIWLDDTID